MRRPLAYILAASVALTAGAGSFSTAALSMPLMPTVKAEGTGDLMKVQNRKWRHRGGGNRGHRGSHGRRGGDRDTYWGGGRRHHGGYHHGRRYSHYYPRHYGHYYNRGYYDNDYYGPAVALGIFGLATGAILGSQYYNNGYYRNGYYDNGYYGNGYAGSDWASACARKYRSFDPASGTYLGYDGYRHECRLP